MVCDTNKYNKKKVHKNQAHQICRGRKQASEYPSIGRSAQGVPCDTPTSEGIAMISTSVKSELDLPVCKAKEANRTQLSCSHRLDNSTNIIMHSRTSVVLNACSRDLLYALTFRKKSFQRLHLAHHAHVPAQKPEQTPDGAFRT